MIGGEIPAGGVPLGALVPMAFTKDQLDEDMGDLNYFGVARLKAGVSVTAANSEIDADQQDCGEAARG